MRPYLGLGGWREDAGYRVFHFATWAKARAMQHWIDRTGIAHQPVPKLGLSQEEKAQIEREALAWGLNTGAMAPIVRAYVGRRATRCRPRSTLPATSPRRWARRTAWCRAR